LDENKENIKNNYYKPNFLYLFQSYFLYFFIAFIASMLNVSNVNELKILKSDGETQYSKSQKIATKLIKKEMLKPHNNVGEKVAQVSVQNILLSLITIISCSNKLFFTFGLIPDDY
jgi:hypothetical protein